MCAKRIFSVLAVLFLLLSVPCVAKAASSITLDGSFGDWADKPSLVFPQGAGDPEKDITVLKWYPDPEEGNLYLYAERKTGDDVDKNKKFEDWDFTVQIRSGAGERTAQAAYHPPSRFVEVRLTDASGNFLWSGKGKWGAEKEAGNALELALPFSCLAGSPTTGYQVDFHIQSGSQRVPVSGDITVSTIGTFPLLALVLLIAWLVLLVIFRSVKIYFFVFLFGSVGLFGFLMYAGLGTVEKYLEYGVTYAVGLIGSWTGLFMAVPDYAMITIRHGAQALSFFVDYECSGFIESLVYFSLIVFYPVHRLRNRLIYAAAGIVFVFIANVIRVFVICVITKVFGGELFFISHTVLARILFFLFMVVLYYRVFTRPHILKQKVGHGTYGR